MVLKHFHSVLISKIIFSRKECCFSFSVVSQWKEYLAVMWRMLWGHLCAAPEYADCISFLYHPYIKLTPTGLSQWFFLSGKTVLLPRLPSFIKIYFVLWSANTETNYMFVAELLEMWVCHISNKIGSLFLLLRKQNFLHKYNCWPLTVLPAEPVAVGGLHSNLSVGNRIFCSQGIKLSL